MKFQKGVSGNPRGRPKGALNKKISFVQEVCLQILEYELVPNEQDSAAGQAIVKLAEIRDTDTKAYFSMIKMFADMARVGTVPYELESDSDEGEAEDNMIKVSFGKPRKITPPSDEPAS